MAKSGFQFDGYDNEIGQNQIDCQNLWMLAQHVKQQKHELEAKLKVKEEMVICDTRGVVRGNDGGVMLAKDEAAEVGLPTALRYTTEQDRRS